MLWPVSSGLSEQISDPGKDVPSSTWRCDPSPQVYQCRYHSGDARLWCSSRTKPHDPSAVCLPACKSGVFVLGDVRAQHAVHYSWCYATAETLFQRSRTESDQLENQKVRYRRVLLFLWCDYRASLAVLRWEKHQRFLPTELALVSTRTHRLNERC